MRKDTRHLLEKIQELPPDRIAEIEDFVDFIGIREQERTVTRAAAATSGAVFEAIWSDPEDDAYDAL